MILARERIVRKKNLPIKLPIPGLDSNLQPQNWEADVLTTTSQCQNHHLDPECKFKPGLTVTWPDKEWKCTTVNSVSNETSLLVMDVPTHVLIIIF